MGLKWNRNRLQPVKGLSVPLQSADFSRRSLNHFRKSDYTQDMIYKSWVIPSFFKACFQV